MLARRTFLGRLGNLLILPAWSLAGSSGKNPLRVQTVSGSIPASRMGTTLPHEHLLVDFIGADQVNPLRYDIDEVIARVTPYLLQLKSLGCRTLIECTPAYLGRDPVLLKLLTERTGINLITNTGFYSAVRGKYLPAWVQNCSAAQLADLWIGEFRNGIDGSGVRPGFIKTSVDDAPLTDYNRKVLEAAAITHRETGLTIACHSGTGAMEAIQVVLSNGVAGNAFVWVHAQSAPSMDLYLEAAEKGAWIELDGLSTESLDDHLDRLKFLRENKLLNQVLLSHDAGWYSVGDAGGGTYRPHSLLFTDFIPRLRKSSFSGAEIAQLTQRNPAAAFGIQKRLL